MQKIRSELRRPALSVTLIGQKYLTRESSTYLTIFFTSGLGARAILTYRCHAGMLWARF